MPCHGYAQAAADTDTIKTTPRGRDLLADPVALSAVKHGYVTAIEGCVRTARGRAGGFAAPDSNTDAVRAAGAHASVDDSVTESVARAVGFRSILVHRYAEVEDPRVVANLDVLGDLDRFAPELGGQN